jgi:formylglycine-generating enzyme required for sulfatase activity
MGLKLWMVIPVLAGGIFASGPVRAQEISHVQFQFDNQNQQILITYDFYDPRETASDVMVQASHDQGKTWSLFPAPSTLSGDVLGVKPGKEKSIVWKVGDGWGGLSPDSFQVRLMLVTSSASSAAAPDPTAEATREAGLEEKENQAELDQSKKLPPTLAGKDGAVLVLIPAGYFTMGSPKGEGDGDQHPAHKVWVSSFYMDRTLVTFDQYDHFCDVTGRQKPVDGFTSYSFKVQSPHWGRGKRPVLNLTWKEADGYCRWAGGRLPTEAEWEKAARGGTETPYFWGKDAGPAVDYAWYAGDSRYKTWPVGELKPNLYGLYDIVGNLWQWVSDWYGSDYYANSPDRNPTGPAEGKLKVLRGGSFANGDDCLRVAYRSSWDADKEDGEETMGHLREHGCRCVSPVLP